MNRVGVLKVSRASNKINIVINIKISFIKIFSNIIGAFANGGRGIFLF